MERVGVQIPAWAEPLTQPAFCKSISGGRGSSKTWTVARLLLYRAALKKMRIFCCREIQNSIEDSNFQVIKNQIALLGLEDAFEVGGQKIKGKNGSEFHFWGLEKRRSSIYGWEGVDVCWIEQAERMTEETWKVIEPTMSRNQGSEIWLTWNPIYRTDYVWKRFKDNPRDKDIVIDINYADLPQGFFADSFYEIAEELKAEDPNMYAHLYLGVPDDGSADTKILTYEMLKQCVSAYEQGLYPTADYTATTDMGFDIADGGVDYNAVCVRRGPCIEFIDKWKSQSPGFLAPSAARAHDAARQYGVWRVNFDSTGVGSPMRGELSRMDPHYMIRPIIFGGKPGGDERNYDRGMTNAQIFSKKDVQMGFAVRARARNTLRLLNGIEGIEPNECLFINPDLPNIDQYFAQLMQPAFRRTPATGKLEVDKRDGAEKSPDLFDATIMAFARDSDNGLRATRG